MTVAEVDTPFLGARSLHMLPTLWKTFARNTFKSSPKIGTKAGVSSCLCVDGVADILAKSLNAQLQFFHRLALFVVGSAWRNRYSKRDDIRTSLGSLCSVVSTGLRVQSLGLRLRVKGSQATCHATRTSSKCM